MPYPLSPGACRLCRDLFSRQVNRVQDSWDRGGKCPRCHERGCYESSCSEKKSPPEQPVRSIWDEKLSPRTSQKFNNVPPWEATH